MRSSFLLFCFWAIQLNGQGYFAQLDSISFSGHSDSLVIIEGIQVQNVSGQFLDMAWQRTSQNIPLGWTASICDGMACRPPHIDFALYELDTAWNHLQNKIWMYYYPDSVSGTGNTTLQLWDVGAQYDTLTLYFECTASLSLGVQVIEYTELFFYPNPANDYIFIRTDDQKPRNWEILTLNGLSIRKGTLKRATTHIDISSLPAGSYVLRSGEFSRMFLVN